MTEIIIKLKTFFKRKADIPNRDDGDDHSCGEYWEFNDPDDVKY
jgi:hypothetical protein